VNKILLAYLSFEVSVLRENLRVFWHVSEKLATSSSSSSTAEIQQTLQSEPVRKFSQNSVSHSSYTPHPADPSLSRSKLLGWNVAWRRMRDYSLLVYRTNKVHRMWWQSVEAKIILEVASDDAWFISYQATLVEFDQYRQKRAASCFVSYTWTVHFITVLLRKSVRDSVVKKCILLFTQNLKVPRKCPAMDEIRWNSVPAESHPLPQKPIILGALVKQTRKTRLIEPFHVLPPPPPPPRGNSREFSYLEFLRLLDTFRFWWKRTVTRHVTRKLPYIYDVSPLLVLVIGADFALQGTCWGRENNHDLNISDFIYFKCPCLPYFRRLRNIDYDRY